MNHPGIVLVLIALSLLNATLIFFVAKQLLHSIYSLKWSSVLGVMQIMDNLSGVDDDGTFIPRYRCRYTYRVADRDYKGHNVNYGWRYKRMTETRLRFVASKYPNGKEVKVYYDPASPATSVLEPGNSRPIMYVLLLLVAILIIILLVTIGIGNYPGPIKVGHDGGFAVICWELSYA